ncbi:MAG TPA: DUF2225 domain-containing protein [Lachnospiraceae bacterium]|nr:DUF2225 domain-containing protein [Lachnospiraceae bacterium]
MGILSGLGNMGLGKFENTELFEKESEKEKKHSGTAKVMTELDFLFDKSYTCPVCDEEFKVRTIKVGKAKLLGTDTDLRPKYEKIDPLKYDVIVCPNCGYAAISRYYKSITPPQAKLIKENISKNFKNFHEKMEYTYDDAIERYQLALANAVVKRARASEKAYICLKMAWLVRGKMETYELESPDYDEVMEQMQQDEAELLKNAMEGFVAARQTENFPLCGMDEMTVDYLIAVIATKFEKYEIASKMISGILISPNANARMKDKARDLKHEILMALKQKKE